MEHRGSGEGNCFKIQEVHISIECASHILVEELNKLDNNLCMQFNVCWLVQFGTGDGSLEAHLWERDQLFRRIDFFLPFLQSLL